MARRAVSLVSSACLSYSARCDTAVRRACIGWMPFGYALMMSSSSAGTARFARRSASKAASSLAVGSFPSSSARLSSSKVLFSAHSWIGMPRWVRMPSVPLMNVSFVSVNSTPSSPLAMLVMLASLYHWLPAVTPLPAAFPQG